MRSSRTREAAATRDIGALADRPAGHGAQDQRPRHRAARPVHQLRTRLTQGRRNLGRAFEKWLGRALEPVLLYEYPTIESPRRIPRGERPSACGSLPEPAAPAAEPIAIIGIGCRFPGGERARASFWRLLLGDGIDATSEVPADRWDVDAYDAPDRAVPGRMNVRRGGFLGRVDGFDADFFGISPREAVRIDPQQRLLLEVAWEALEDAGQAPDRLAGTEVGVYIGISTKRLQRASSTTTASPAILTPWPGTPWSIAANRLSYLLDLRGPSSGD